MNYTPQKQAKPYYVQVRDALTQYVWNMNYPTIITKESINKAYIDWYSNTHGNVGKYNKSYYDNKLKVGEGKPGSDCSGMHYGLSGYDTTAQGYYDEVSDEKKGTIDTLPLHDLLLLFRGKSPKNIVHTGAYLGNGMTIHMANSIDNCVYEPTDNGKWKWWAYAKFIDYSKPLGDKPILTRILKMGSKGIDVKLLQDQLILKGYKPGIIDGDFGKNTDEAVKNFQKDNKITPDGIVGKATCKKLGMLWRGPSY